LLADFGNFLVLVLVVTIAVVVIVVLAILVLVLFGLLVDLQTRNAVVHLDNRFFFVRERVSVVESLVYTGTGVRSATRIVVGCQIDTLSITSTHGTNVVTAVHIDTVAVRAAGVVTVSVVLVVSVSSLQSFTSKF
jgi:hypothetical protein